MVPKVLVIFATYNGERFIIDQLESLKIQCGVNLTLLLSDDFSTDNTVSKIKSNAGNLNIIELVNSSRYCSASRNFLNVCSRADIENYDYIALCDQDDIWFPNKLLRAIEFIEKLRVDAYSSNVLAFWEERGPVKTDKAHPAVKYDHFFEAAGPGCTYVMKSSAFNVVRSKFSPICDKLSVQHDWLLYFLFRKLGFFWYIDEVPSMWYRQHENNDFGINKGLSAKFSRLIKLRAGWYREQITQLCNVGECRFPWEASWTEIFRSIFQYRRKKFESISVMFFILIIKLRG